MAPWAFMRVNYVPMTLGIVFSLGLVTCFTVAVLRGDVSPYMPFISETGGKFPEAGIFSIFLYLSSTIGLSTMFVRFLIVDELNRGIDRSIDILNRISIVIGFIALMGMVVVAAYPMTSVPIAHGIGANVLFLGAVAYAALQTWLSYKMSPYYNGQTICHIRLAVTVLSAVSLIALTVTLPISMSLWSTTSHDHWTGGKTPNDKGFYLMVTSSVAEWTMAIMFLTYYFTFIREFGKVCFHVRVQMLVQHFDEDPIEANISVATERTPIVMHGLKNFQEYPKLPGENPRPIQDLENLNVFKVDMKCQHAKDNRVSGVRPSKKTNCPATFNLVVKRSVSDYALHI